VSQNRFRFFYIFNKSVKTESISVISHQKFINSPTSPKIMSPHYLVKRKSSCLQCISLLLYKCLTPSVHNDISIFITSIYCVSCLQCSVNRSFNSLPQ